ncbi:hypothetical protein [Bacillus velezensis]|uniref:hypothetical protein n=1 Tax=Bacillus TaxID=1386 RepID=UPI0013798A3C|nr:hypothetical protein [Bacillus velezensis]
MRKTPSIFKPFFNHSRKNKGAIEKISTLINRLHACLFFLFVERLGLHLAALNGNGDCEKPQLASDG